jgi:hypothetical protein
MSRGFRTGGGRRRTCRCRLSIPPQRRRCRIVRPSRRRACSRTARRWAYYKAAGAYAIRKSLAIAEKLESAVQT